MISVLRAVCVQCMLSHVISELLNPAFWEKIFARAPDRKVERTTGNQLTRMLPRVSVVGCLVILGF